MGKKKPKTNLRVALRQRLADDFFRIIAKINTDAGTYQGRTKHHWYQALPSARGERDGLHTICSAGGVSKPNIVRYASLADLHLVRITLAVATLGIQEAKGRRR